MSLFVKKPLSALVEQAETGEHSLKRTLTAGSLVALGIGAIIGAGLFTRTAAAAAEHAGPSVTLAFLVAAIGCAFAGLCYAELSSSIPIAGSAYTYSYATMGELVAWVIGWDLILEYAVGAATVGIAWSEYLNNLLTKVLHTSGIPYQWFHSPLQVSDQGVHGIINLPALFIVTALTFLLIRGTQESAIVNSVIVVTKVSIVVLIIVLGWGYINPANHVPYIPEPSIYTSPEGMTYHFGGIEGILGAAGTVFFAFIGFDAVSTAAQEAKDPKRDMPIGILGSLAICTVLYILFSHVLTGIGSLADFRGEGREASVAFVINKYMPSYTWLGDFVTVAILAGFSSVILVMLLGQSRVFYSMSHDGLLPKMFSDLHPTYRTPYKANILILGLVGIFAAFVPEDIVGEMTSIGTLFAFILVCMAVIILRHTDPDLPRSFRTPLVPVVPALGVLVCGFMIWGLGAPTWIRLFVWLALGFGVYFGYSQHHSVLRLNPPPAEAEGGYRPPTLPPSAE